MVSMSVAIHRKKTKFVIKISRSEEFHFGGSSGGEMPHFMQFSVATRELFRKCPKHPSNCFLTTAAEEKQTFHRQAISLLAWSFHPMI